MIVQKKHGKTVRAYELGAGTEAEQRMMAESKMLAHSDGSYELFSQETDEHGERAKAGDFFKIDSSDQPYPNARAYFLSNHKPLDEPDTYEQIPAAAGMVHRRAAVRGNLLVTGTKEAVHSRNGVCTYRA